MATPSKRQPTRQRAGSIKEAIENIETDPRHHLAGPFVESTGSTSEDQDSASLKRRPKKFKPKKLEAEDHVSRGLVQDIKTMQWMRSPASSFKLLLIPWILYFNWALIAPKVWNPFSYLLMIQYRMPDSPSDAPLYTKGYGDIAFACYYVIVFSFIRQSLVIYFLRPLARYFGIRKDAKIERFTEQGYAILYFSCTGTVGLWIMYHSEHWYFKTTPYWLGYPYWKLSPVMKSYYLIQFSYWFQQLLVLALRLEKPRKDFYELVGHHFVTLWLIGWSYLVNFTPMGNAVFITMDISDTFLALAKSLNYMGKDSAATVAFGWFVLVWTYLRHYLNIQLLWSVLTEFKLLAPHTRQWNPSEGVWMPAWLQWQIFIPMLLLQLVNIFWYFLIWRILLRAVFGTKDLADDRSDDEGDDDELDEDKDD